MFIDYTDSGQHRQWSPNCISNISGGIFMARGKSTRETNWGLWGGVIAGAASLIPFIPMIRRRAMRVTTILKKDHRMVSGLIMTLQMTPKFNSTVRKSLFNQINNNLS